MIDTLGGLGALLYGTALVWAAVNITSHQARLVRAPRPAHLVYMRIAAVWTLGAVSVLAGLGLVAQGVLIIDGIS